MRALDEGVLGGEVGLAFQKPAHALFGPAPITIRSNLSFRLPLSLWTMSPSNSRANLIVYWLGDGWVRYPQ